MKHKQKPRRQKDPALDAELTRRFYSMMNALVEPPRPIDGERGPFGIIGWVQMDVRFLAPTEAER